MATRPSKLETLRRNYHYLAETLRGLEVDLRWGLEGSDRIPAEWAEIAREPPSVKKTQVSMRLDADVVAFFRALGPGYLTQINRVLRAYMLARLADVVKGAEAEVYKPTGMELYLTGVMEVMEATHLRNAQVRDGQSVVALDIAIDRKTVELRRLEDKLGLSEDMRVLGPVLDKHSG